MHDRRGFLAMAVAAALGLTLPLGWAVRRGLSVERRGKVFIVDGWILTAADVRALAHVL